MTETNSHNHIISYRLKKNVIFICYKLVLSDDQKLKAFCESREPHVRFHSPCSRTSP